MSVWNPREAALRHPRVALLIFGLLWVLFGYGNLIAVKGAPLENAMVNPHDPYRQMDDHVRDQLAAGFQGHGEILPFFLYFPQGISTRQDLLRIVEFSDRVRGSLGEAVLSLAIMPRYVDQDGTVTSTPYITHDLPLDFDVSAWKEQVRSDPGVYGILVGRQFEWAVVTFFVPAGRDEVPTYRRVVEFIEGRKIPWWEWFYKTDVMTPPDMGIGSHLIVHGILDGGINLDVVTLATLGVVLSFPILFFSLGGIRPALLSVFVIVLTGMLWTRGAVGLGQLMGIAVKERVYLCLAYTNCIVQGVSFSLHKYESFNEAEGSSRAQRWRGARTVDGLLSFTALIGILGFASLYWFQVYAMRELGVLAALGVVFIFVNTCITLPAADLTFARASEPARSSTPFLARGSDTLARGIAALKPGICLAVLAVLLVSTSLLIWPGGKLDIWTRPLAWVTGSIVDRTAAFVNVPGRIGFEALELLVEPAADGSIQDSEFLQQATRFVKDIEHLEPTRETASILPTVSRISEESFGVPLPRTVQEAGAVFFLLDSGLPREVATKLYYDHGIRVSVYHGLERTDLAGQFQDHVLQIARDIYPGLRVSSYGEMSLFPQWDRYIRIGKPLNVVSSQWVVILLCGLNVFLFNRRHPGRAGLGPFRGGLIASAPLVFAIPVTALAMMALRIPLDATTAMITALALNASIDFAIYLLDGYQEGLALNNDRHRALEHAVKTKGRLILMDMVLNEICFVPLLFSQFSPVADTGWIMLFMLPACAAGTLLIMGPLLPLGVKGGPIAATGLPQSSTNEVSPRHAA